MASCGMIRTPPLRLSSMIFTAIEVEHASKHCHRMSAHTAGATRGCGTTTSPPNSDAPGVWIGWNFTIRRAAGGKRAKKPARAQSPRGIHSLRWVGTSCFLPRLRLGVPNRVPWISRLHLSDALNGRESLGSSGPALSLPLTGFAGMRQKKSAITQLTLVRHHHSKLGLTAC